MWLTRIASATCCDVRITKYDAMGWIELLFSIVILTNYINNAEHSLVNSWSSAMNSW